MERGDVIYRQGKIISWLTRIPLNKTYVSGTFVYVVQVLSVRVPRVIVKI